MVFVQLVSHTEWKLGQDLSCGSVPLLRKIRSGTESASGTEKRSATM